MHTCVLGNSKTKLLLICTSRFPIHKQKNRETDWVPEIGLYFEKSSKM